MAPSTYPFGLRLPALRSDMRADLLASLDVRPQAPTAAPTLMGYAAPPEPMFRGPTPPLPQSVAAVEPPAAPPTPPSADDRSWQVSDALAADPNAMLDQGGDARAQGRRDAAGAGMMSSFLSGLRSGANLGFYDEIGGAGAASGLPEWLPQSVRAPVGLARMGLEQIGVGSGAGQAYADGRDRARGYAEASAEANPVAEFAGNLAGGLTLPGAAAVKGAGLLANAGRGLVAGAATGAAAGFGSGEGLTDRAERAGIGGTLGGTLGAGIGGLAGRFAGRAMPEGPVPVPPSVPLPQAPLRAAGPVERAAPARAYRVAEDTVSMAAPDDGSAFLRGLTGGADSGPASGPYGKAASMTTDDGMEAIRAGILRNLEDPTLGRSIEAPAPLSSPLGFGPYGKAAPGTVGAGMDAIRSALLSPSARGLGAFGLAGAGALSLPGEASAAGLAPRSAEDFAATLRAAPPGSAQASAQAMPSFGAGSQMPNAPQMPPARAQRQTAPAARAMTSAPPPPPRPAEFGAPAADMPAPNAVPTSGRAPSPATPTTEEPSFLDRLMGGIQKTDGLLGSIGIGLLTTPGLGAGLGAGLKNHQQAGVQKAATNLAQAEFQLKQRKLQQEDLGKNLTYQSLVRKGVSAEDAQAAIAASMAGHGEALSNLLNNNFRKVPDAPAGYATNPNGTMRKIPGGPADKPDEPFNLSKGQTRYDASGKVIVTAPDEEADAFTREGKLRGEFTKGLGTFQDVHDGYGRVIAATRQREANPKGVSPASDIGLIFGYMKMLDPGSVVREGEFATAQNAAGIPERVRNVWNKAMQGEFLTPEQRQDFIGQAGELYGTARKGAEAVAGRYRNLAGQYKVDPDRTVALPEMPMAPTVGPNRMQPGKPQRQGSQFGPIPGPAAQALQRDPGLREQFDAKYGAGAADMFLRGR